VNEQVIAELADRIRSRFYGKYRGIVTDVDDPSKMLRIKATVPAVLGETPTGWCLPCVPYAGADVGVFLLPDPGAAVWIEFEGGDISYPIWSGCFWRSGELPADASATTRGLVTKADSKLLFDDDGETVTLEDTNGNTVTLDSSGVTQNRGAQKVIVGDASVSINDGAFEVS
jgi:uncharacterized protein involved in type VI secretion and phage assembly